MDSLTQACLGATLGEAVLGRQVGNKALIWGAIAGTLPDLDLLVTWADPVKVFTYHRGVSHAFLFLALLALLLTPVITRIHPRTKSYRHRWFCLVLLALVTHPLLDCLTVYGTQVFLPFDNTPVAWSTIFIIDPIYSLLLLAGVLSAWRMSRQELMGHRLSTLGLILSCVYLALACGAKVRVESLARLSLDRQGIASDRVLTSPSPFNVILWRILAMDQEGYVEGFYSLLDSSRQVAFAHYSSQTPLLDDIQNEWSVRRLKWFTRGFYRVDRTDGEIAITDLRMGQEPDYVFSFKVGRLKGGETWPIRAQRVQQGWPKLSSLLWVWKRIWNESVQPP